MDRAIWGADTRPSLPEPPPNPVLVDLGGTGFVFTVGGIAHNVTASSLEENYTTPTFMPPPIPTQGKI